MLYNNNDNNDNNSGPQPAAEDAEPGRAYCRGERGEPGLAWFV